MTQLSRWVSGVQRVQKWNNIIVVINIGDLVRIRDNYISPSITVLQSHTAPGIVTDVLEDDAGYRHIEVEFVEDRGWFEDFMLTVVSDEKENR